MAGPRVLALDIGTSSIRASIYNDRLAAVRIAQIRYRWHEYRDRRVEMDAHSLERLVIKAIDEVLDGRRASVRAVGAAAFWHSLIGVDAADRPLTPVIPWSDLRADDDAVGLRRELNERSVHTRTGCRLHASYWPARLRWFARCQPRLFARVRRWITFTEWLERRWLGRRAVSVSQASGTGLLVQDTCRWDSLLMRACGVEPDALSPIVDVNDESAVLAARLRRRWPSLDGARWLPSVGDGAVNNVGAACATQGRAALMIGTSGALRVLWEPPNSRTVRQPFGLWRYRLDRRRVVIGGALSNAGNVRDWVSRTFGIRGRIDARVARLPPDAHGLTFLPFFAGTRSPDYLADATAVITGLTFATAPEHVLRAAMEAVAYRFALVFDLLASTISIEEIVAAGGALERSTAWTQILADVLGRPITISADRELTSRGAAALAFEQIGVLDVAQLRPTRSHVVRPDAQRHRVYAKAMDRQMELMKRLY